MKEKINKKVKEMIVDRGKSDCKKMMKKEVKETKKYKKK